MPDFAADFAALTGHPPFPWQRALHDRFRAGDFPAACDLPTGLGKTSVIPLWLLALAAAPERVPRRLVYVVNRRTVVDQATREAEALRAHLPARPHLHQALAALGAGPADRAGPLAISTLRGQFADNGAWRGDPARPAVVVGTVDMVGSRLLFAGYGCGYRSRPLHAGFLGHDALLVHDEAHLEPAFQHLLEQVHAFQRRQPAVRPFHVLALTATPRTSGPAFALTADDEAHDVVARRLASPKRLLLHPLDDPKKTAERLAELAAAHDGSGAAVLVYARAVEDVEKVADLLARGRPGRVERLTGTLRGRERDRLAATSPVFARFLPRRPTPDDPPPTVWLAATSAGEVGIDISADHLVADLSTFDSMTQRLGRVNRFGDRADTRVDVVHPTTLAADDDDGGDDLDRRRALTLALLRRLDGDASPAALRRLPAADRLAAFTPPPVVRPLTDALVEAWALTSIRTPLPGRPPVADWLHGLTPHDPPRTAVAWREEVAILSDDPFTDADREDLLADYPLQAHELLADRTDRVARHLGKLADRPAARQLSAWLIDPDGAVNAVPLPDLTRKGGPRLDNRTVLLPPEAGGLTLDEGESRGTLAGEADFDGSARAEYDVSGHAADPAGAPRRARVWDDEDAPAGMRLIRVVDTQPGRDRDEPAGRRFWRWYVRPRSADDDGSRTARTEQTLADHAALAERHACALAGALGLPEAESAALVWAARHHDDGKARRLWQRSVGNHDPARVLAKSDGRGGTTASGYRHEFGSLLQARDAPSDLARHLIAAHHGRARPHFPADEAFDPDADPARAADEAKNVLRRYVSLQRQYGVWGLAYLESLLRAADALASQAGPEEP